MTGPERQDSYLSFFRARVLVSGLLGMSWGFLLNKPKLVGLAVVVLGIGVIIPNFLPLFGAENPQVAAARLGA